MEYQEATREENKARLALSRTQSRVSVASQALQQAQRAYDASLLNKRRVLIDPATTVRAVGA